MGKILNYLLIWRSLPCLIVYRLLSLETRSLIQADMKRYGSKAGLLALHEILLHNGIFRRQFFVRVLGESKFKYRLCRWCYKPLFGLEISSIANRIGGGLQIIHGYSTIIYCHSMGENCTVYQNVTLGRGKSVNGINAPIIGNNVTIYTGAIIIGGVHIGDNAKIAAGAVVVKDVPPNSTAVGQQARIITKAGEKNDE